jgi:hypothetical protein
VIPFLSRRNPLNVFLGGLRTRWSRRHGPAYELSPLALGLPPISPDDPSRS